MASRSEKPTRGARILGLGISVPRFSASQSAALGFMARVLREGNGTPARDRALDFLDQLRETSGIETRHSVIPDYGFSDPSSFEFFPRNWNLEPFPTTARRMQAYEESSVLLAEVAAMRALAMAAVEAGAVTHLVVCTCTGFFAPGPDIEIVRRLRLAPTVQRTIIGFMGCHAGLVGLRTADQIVRAEPGAIVLQICVELCSLHYQKGAALDVLVANSIFADGCAALVHGTASGACRGLATVQSSLSLLGDGTGDQMTWHIGDEGFRMRLDRRIPDSLKAEAPPFVDLLLQGAGLRRADVGGWAIHPGGKRIVEAVGDALSLDDHDLEPCLSILRDFGNISSGTIFIVLEKLLRRGALSDPMVALAFGPGLTMEGAVLLP